jgi:xanthine dehydrogenase accessory factor
MPELKEILALAQRASAAREEACVATVVGIEGSAYRRPGARMVLTASGERAGTVSGGCLEGEIAKKAWWLTEKGPSLQRYSSFFDDDGDTPYGLGCGGTIAVLLERGEPARQVLEALRQSVEDRTAFVIVTGTDAKTPGTQLILRDDGAVVYSRGPADNFLLHVAQEAMARRTTGPLHGHGTGALVEYIAPPPALWVFGAGDDAQPLVEFAAALDWHVTVADGRSQLALAERFPRAARTMSLDAALAAVVPRDAAVIMTHSYEQDRAALAALLRLGMKYLGILGPLARTERLVAEAAPQTGLSAAQCLSRLHAPVGLDLGAHSPAAIALSIVAELQAVLAGREPKKLNSSRLIHV